MASRPTTQFPTVQRRLAVFGGLCLFRSLNTMVVQSYFDPDEYWQTLEPAYCHVFYQESLNDGGHNDFLNDRNIDNSNISIHEKCPGFTWEWKRWRQHRREMEDYDGTTKGDNDDNYSTIIPTPVLKFLDQSFHGPARTYLGVLPVWLYYKCLKSIMSTLTTAATTTTTATAMTTSYWWWWLVARGPMVLWAVSVAAPTDYAIWYVAHWLPTSHQENDGAAAASNSTPTILPGWCLFGSLVSWFGAFSMVRTLANGQETMLLAWSVVWVAPELWMGSTTTTTTVTAHDDWSKSRIIRASLAFFLGGLATSIRSTAIAAYVPLGLVLAVSEPTIVSQITYLLHPCALFGGLGLAAAACVDRLGFGIWTLPALGNFYFNAVENHASLYGAHPWHWNFTAALPVVTGLLLPLILWEFLAVSAGLWQSRGTRNLTIVALCYLVVLSLNAHKEFRYILPILPIGCWLAGPAVARFCTKSTSSDHNQTPKRQLRVVRLLLLIVPNVVALLYLGLFHQSGAISVNRWIVRHALQQRFDKNSNWEDDTAPLSIYYLTGSCHSTPLHSHLHAPPLQFATVTLDCSPSCRKAGDCETQRFDQDPAQYLTQLLLGKETTTTTTQQCETNVDTNDDDDKQESSCAAGVEPSQRPIDYVVTMSRYREALQPLVPHLEVAARFPFHWRGVRLGRWWTLGGEEDISSSSSLDQGYYYYSLGGSSSRIEVSLDEMIVLAPRR
mmetsp:Transcript_18833/g.51592  ORF Transcript_18833/g.51592 Transcript_18833/m.51592 type:complete len:726 (+) Transcript_18833:131-2308(+)